MASQIPGAKDLRITSGLDLFGHGFSNETMLLDLEWNGPVGPEAKTVVLRRSPGEDGLLAPYDIPKQFHIMRALGESGIPVPGMLWLDEAGVATGRACLVMERVDGVSFDTDVPEHIAELDSGVKRSMIFAVVETLARIHLVDWQDRGLGFLGDGLDALRGEVDRWHHYGQRFALDAMPMAAEVLQWLQVNEPTPSDRVSLVHGDAKWGNFMWSETGQMTSVNDWELAGVGDPLLDLGYFLEVAFPAGQRGPRPMDEHIEITERELIDLYASISGVDVSELAWYRAVNCYKLAAICCGMQGLYDAGKTEDSRMSMGAKSAEWYINRALTHAGIDLATTSGSQG